MRIALTRLLVVGSVVLLVASGCDGDPAPIARVKSEVDLTAAQREAVVEFSGTIVVSTTVDDVVARFGRDKPFDDATLRRAGVGSFVEEERRDGAWQAWVPGENESPLVLGPNEVRYRWTITLADGAESGTLPIEAWLTAAFLHGNLSPPTEDEVTVSLEITSVTYP